MNTNFSYVLKKTTSLAIRVLRLESLGHIPLTSSWTWITLWPLNVNNPLDSLKLVSFLWMLSLFEGLTVFLKTGPKWEFCFAFIEVLFKSPRRRFILLSKGIRSLRDALSPTNLCLMKSIIEQAFVKSQYVSVKREKKRLSVLITSDNLWCSEFSKHIW